MARQGQLFIISAPSGAGKTSLVKALAERLPTLIISVSYTTRPMRQGEVDGVNYFFISETEFEDMIKNKSFLEHATVFGHHYGTASRWVIEQLQRGYDVVLEIDWQGARQVKLAFPDAKTIFILPPSLEALLERLKSRAQDSEAIIAHRMEKAHDEMLHYSEFDYLVFNASFDLACDELETIIRAEHLTLSKQRLLQKKLLAQLIGV